MKGVPALIKPSLLTWARESARLSLDAVADKMNVTRQRAIDWEAGTEQLTIPQLRKFGQICKRPLAVFFLDAPPKDFNAAKLPDYRKLPDMIDGISPELAYELRRAAHRQQIAAELAEQIHYELPIFDLRATMAEDPDLVAERLREFLGVTFEQQKAWENSNEALRTWRFAAQECGVLVFRMSLPIEEVRGFSFGSARLPAIVLNAKEPPVARIFTLLHEMVHLALQEGGICDLHEDGDYADAEVFCNRVAGAAAVPARVLEQQPDVYARKSDRDWDDTAFGMLARRFHVSREVIARRLLILGFVSQDLYQEKRKQWLKEVKRPASGFEPPADKSIRTNGELFTRLVLSSHAEQAITLADVASYLDVRVTHLDAIARSVWA